MHNYVLRQHSSKYMTRVFYQGVSWGSCTGIMLVMVCGPPMPLNRAVEVSRVMPTSDFDTYAAACQIRIALLTLGTLTTRTTEEQYFNISPLLVS